MTGKMNLDKSKIKILVCCHKPCELPQDDIFLPIHCGKALSDLNLGIQGDNEVNGMPCDNISEKNDTYCELTAIYWAWKNIKKLYPDIEYIGLNHYRRYFMFKNNLFTPPVYCKYPENISEYRIDYNKLIKYLKYPLLTSPVYRKTPIASAFTRSCINPSDYRTLKSYLMEHDLTSYNDLRKNVESHNQYHSCNMFIMRYQDFCKYCEWLFNILFNIEDKIPYKYYKNPERRVMGYLGELLLSVYVRINKLPVSEVPKIFYTEKPYNDLAVIFFFKKFLKIFASFIFVKLFK